MTFDALLKSAAQRLQRAGSPSPRIDAEVLMAFAASRSRTWLYTWGDSECPTWEHARFDALVAARAQGQPVAYLTGEREFWGLPLATSPSTLIPRPDTETLVDVVLARAKAPSGRLLDLGTGTGAIALAFASERPMWQVIGVDVRPETVSLATHNAQTLHIANATFLLSDWFASLGVPPDGDAFDIIVSNPPYIAADDPHLSEGDVRFEPRSALVAEGDGMADLMHLIIAAQAFLSPGGWLALEHGYQQAACVRQALMQAGYQNVESVQDIGGHERVTLGHLE
ncbi:MULTISPECIES: peptide chain release factor N(5)-glutamine methyltransferase [unclassified Halomonas]|uniref:peptide chain release factor N(5)-glutamine methyltransferase n=1 Tax=unclassified Halomonas TaxID=2609666 RepID=UPI001EF5C935|nr:MULTISPECIES: peptide chain release factor N(5)-glutamine methyltransferase [unclassified Halomonas]MCG7576739.1 peptide chain release factor N(5)-glutamine methyltransferase [Halomonas sp. MMH1-48]MCG7603802.1 peptide chain release factor N(5)-glutamine methyltransferase [Halomonas sp. MM17-34]MCG7613052.1 peptide chain release factor N(5)-glutamine methyltransferase [Halomonas sp. MM17-29]MCG7619660.1 peptide chain release factor N(5)-glutamine methyltransferase [Halomonas sp. DSH1-27]